MIETCLFIRKSLIFSFKLKPAWSEAMQTFLNKKLNLIKFIV